MRIATWNVNDIRKRLPLLLAWLDATQPDVVALQELKVPEADFPYDAIREAGYEACVVGQRTWNGVALLARGAEPVTVRRALPGEPADTQARYVEAAVEGVLFAGLYLPNGNPYPGPKFDYKMAWFERLLSHAQGLLDSGHPVVMLGDFNVIPTDADVYATQSYEDNALRQAPPREAYARLLAQGWCDALRTLHPTEPMYTFWDFRRNRWQRDAGLRIDHVLLSPPLHGALVAAGVDRAVRGMDDASDHAPAWVELTPGAAPASRTRRRRAPRAGSAS